MKIRGRILWGSIVLASSVLNLAACGQTGPLYLPPVKPGQDAPAPALPASTANPAPKADTSP